MSFLTRRKFLGAGLAGAGATVLAGDAFLKEPNFPELRRVEIRLPRLPAAFDGFTIAQLSDFHYDHIFSVHPIRRAVEIVSQLNPDLVVLTGDFVTGNYFADLSYDPDAAKVAEPCAKLLSGIRSHFGSLAVLGNHDVDTDPGFVTDALESHGIPVLRNRSKVLEQRGQQVWVCGLDSIDANPQIEDALQPVPKNATVVLLMHEPDFADVAMKYPVDLQLSGHSHGGQIWLPGFGAPWLPGGARKYPRGRYTVGRLPLYTNIGLGTIRMAVRFNCIPEVTLVTLRTGIATGA